MDIIRHHQAALGTFGSIDLDPFYKIKKVALLIVKLKKKRNKCDTSHFGFINEGHI